MVCKRRKMKIRELKEAWVVKKKREKKEKSRRKIISFAQNTHGIHPHPRIHEERLSMFGCNICI